VFAGCCGIELQETRVSHRDNFCVDLSFSAPKSMNARPDPTPPQGRGDVLSPLNLYGPIRSLGVKRRRQRAYFQRQGKFSMAFKFSRADRLLILRDSVLVVLPTLLGMAYGIASRTPEDFLTYPLVGAALLYVGLFAWMLLNVDMKPTSIRGRHIAHHGWPLYFVAAPALCAILAVAYYGVGVAVKDLTLWAIRPTNLLHMASFAVGLTALAAGTFLFLVRLRFRFVYGLSEAVMGFVVAVYKFTQDLSANNTLSANTYLVVLTAGIYLMVRGFDNMHIGLTKDPLDPIAAKVAAWLFGSGVEFTVKLEKPKNSGSEGQASG
jgi:hypothetical protein